MQVVMRRARRGDAEAINFIFNQAIDDGNSNLDIDRKELSYRQKWLAAHDKRHPVFVGELYSEVVCWVALSPYSGRYPYDWVAELSVYVRRDLRGKGLGTQLLKFIEHQAMELGYYKIILSMYATNQAALHSYRRAGYRDVGVFRNHGYHKGKLYDIIYMERQLTPNMDLLKNYYIETYPFYKAYYEEERQAEEAMLKRNGVLPSPEAGELPQDDSGLPEGIVRFLKSKENRTSGPGDLPGPAKEENEVLPPVIVFNAALGEEAVRQRNTAPGQASENEPPEEEAPEKKAPEKKGRSGKTRKGQKEAEAADSSGIPSTEQY